MHGDARVGVGWGEEGGSEGGKGGLGAGWEDEGAQGADGEEGGRCCHVVASSWSGGLSFFWLAVRVTMSKSGGGTTEEKSCVAQLKMYAAYESLPAPWLGL